ncbi:ABC transporter substrate-binding protein [Shinella sp.]|uniref:ABC transporter substrate-binding protein n=1 Tax=Shinella sp. TaxID=1870904 RepID=UPI003F6EAB92
MMLTRRKTLAIGAGALLAPGLARAAQPRIATIDWAMLETILALGAAPVAATELIQFRQIVVEPAVPQTVADLGLRGAPNLELLRMVSPDLILISAFYEYQRAYLERIAPVEALPAFEIGKPPFPLAEQAALAIGDRLGIPTRARLYIEETAADIAARRLALSGRASRPVFVISLGDARHFRAFGRDAMFGDVLGRLGFANAWTADTSYSAAAPVPLEALAAVPEAYIALVGPMPPDVRWSLPENAIWNALPAVRAGRVAMIETTNHFGGLASARRFARLFHAAMDMTDHG